MIRGSMGELEDDDFLENGLFIRGDGWRSGIPWRLQAYDHKGPLTDDDVTSLSKMFDMTPQLLSKLSCSLGYTLDPHQNVHVVPISRRTGSRRAKSDLATSKKQMSGVVARLEEVVARLSTLCPVDSDEQATRYECILTKFANIFNDLKEAELELTALTLNPAGFIKMEPEDRRVLFDRRRRGVLRNIFQTWVDAGRKVTFTTDPITSDRRGQLIDFAQCVVEYVTEPSTKLKAEAIVDEIRRSGSDIQPTAEYMQEWRQAWESRKK